MMALALLPIEHVEETAKFIEDNSPTEIAEFFKYFNYQWLKRVPPKYWNVANIEFRTNNFTEGEFFFFEKYESFFHQIGWYIKFNNRFVKYHANI